MNKLSRFAGYGIEDAEVVAPVDQLPEVDENMTEEEAELKTEVAEKEVGEVENDIGEMADVAESLEAICIGIQSTLKKGGLTRQGAAFAMQSADMQLNRLGLSGIACSVEDFEEQLPPPTEEVDPIAQDTLGGAEGAGEGVVPSAPAGVEADSETIAQNVAVSQEAMENIKAVITKIWEAIKSALVALKDAIVSFFKKAADFSLTQARRAEAYKKGLKELKEFVVKKEELELGSLAETFAMNGKLATAADVAAVTKLVDAGSKEEAKATVDKLKELTTSLKNFKAGDGTLTFRDFAEKLSAKMSEAKTGALAAGEVTVPGNRVIKVTKSEDGKTSFVAEAVNGAKAAEPATIKQPKVEELVDYCDAVIELAKAVNTVRQTSDATAKALEGASKAIEATSKDMAGKDEKSAAELAKFGSAEIRDSIRENLGYMRLVTGEALKVAKAANGYVGLCYDNFASSVRIAVAKTAGV